MATFNGTVGANADDGLVDSVGSVFSSVSDLNFGDLTFPDHYSAWARWTNVTIPQGSTINSVTVTLRAANSLSGDNCNVNIYFDNEDNASAPTTYLDYTGKPVTSAVAWNAIAHTTAGSDFSAPDLASILQTVINRAGWVSGNALQLFIKSTNQSITAYRDALGHDSDTVNCPRISIDYTAPVTTSSSSSSSSSSSTSSTSTSSTSSSSSSSSTSSTSSSTSSTSSSSSTSSTSSSTSSTSSSSSSSTSSTSSSSSTSSTSSSSSTSITGSSTSSTSSSSSTSSTSTSSTSSSHSTSSTSSSSSISTSSTSSSSTSTTLPPATTSSSSSSTSTSTSTSTTTILFHPKIDILQSLLHGRPSGEFS